MAHMKREQSKVSDADFVFDDIYGKPHTRINGYGSRVFGLPLVDLIIDGDLTHLTVDQARRYGEALVSAAKAAESGKVA